MNHVENAKKYPNFSLGYEAIGARQDVSNLRRIGFNRD